MSFQLTGKLQSIGSEEQKTEKFSVREFVIIVEKYYKKEDKSYPVRFQFTNNKCMELDSSNIQDALRMHLDVKVDFELTGYTSKDGRIWNNLNAISIVPTQSTLPFTGQGTNTNQSAPIAANTPVYQPQAPVEDDLPF